MELGGLTLAVGFLRLSESTQRCLSILTMFNCNLDVDSLQSSKREMKTLFVRGDTVVLVTRKTEGVGKSIGYDGKQNAIACEQAC